MKFFKTLGASLLLAASACHPVHADVSEYDFAVGVAPDKGKGGAYWKVGKDIAEKMGPNGYKVSLITTQGSDEITKLACRENADIWIAQIDAVWMRYTDDKCVLKPTALGAKEYAFLMFPPGSNNDELEDMTAADKVSVTGVNSGTNLTWNNWVRIEKEWGGSDKWTEAATVKDIPIDGLTAAAEFGDVTAAFLVRGKTSDDVKTLLSEGWTVGYAWDRDINDLEFNDKSLYSWSESFDIVTDSGKVWVETFEIQTFIGVSPENELNRQLKKDLLNAAK